MLIAVDIGNTNVTIGVTKDSHVLRTFKLDSASLRLKKKAAQLVVRKVLSKISFSQETVEAIYICSVVPSLNNIIKDVLSSFFQKKVMMVGQDVIVPIINKYRIPHQVGQDRLVNAYAGLKIYGGGLIIVDFGTAITFDIVSKKSEYLGGLIVPGLKLMQEALNKKTALLPYVELSRPIETIGRDTVSSIRAGIIYGTASLCDGIIHRLIAKDCKGFKIVVTGGDAQLIQPYCFQTAYFEEFLILKGLAFIHKSQEHKK